MAIVKCNECDGKISTKASVCPHCGCPNHNEQEKKIPSLKTTDNNICPYCGKNSLGLENCDFCGKELDSDKYINIITKQIKKGSFSAIIGSIFMILIFAAVFIWMIVILFSDSFELKYLLMILPTNALSLMAIFHYFKGVKEGVKRLTRVEESSIAKKLSRYGDFKNICKLLIYEQNINKKFISNGVIFSEKFVMILPPLVAISIDEICHVYKKVTKQNYQIVSQQLVIVDVHNDYIYINWDDKESMLIIEYLANKNQNIKIGY